MLNFDPERYLGIQRGALRAGRELAAVVDEAVSQGLRTVFFLGAGGAGILMGPAAQLLAARSRLRTIHCQGAELVAHGSPSLDSSSLVVVPSLSGTTPDAIDHVRYCKDAGARVLGLLGNGDTPLGELADHVVVNPAADDTSSESFYLQSYVLALTLMHRIGELTDLEPELAQLDTLPESLLEAKRRAEPQAEELANRLAASDYHLFTGAGSTWPQAHYYAMCILEEMQWIRTRPVHASDFFHGSLELIEPGVSTVLLKGEGPARHLVERVEAFVHDHTGAVTVLDAAEFPTAGVAAHHRAWLSPVILAAVLERVSAHLEVQRDHPLTTRRYYRKVAY